MEKLQLSYIRLLFFFMLCINSAKATNYYIDSVNGLDTNNGTSILTPWKNISKINALTITPGSIVSLKCGSIWNGQQLKFLGSGTATAPIIVDQYSTGAKPIINGDGLATTDQGVVYLYNQDYIEINNLEITNYPSSSSITNPDSIFFVGLYATTGTNLNPLGADRRGVMVALKDKGVSNHIYLKNLNVHHVKGQLGNGNTAVNGAIPKRTGGIYFAVLNESATSNSRFNDVLIDGCNVNYCENIGIAFDNEDNVYYPGADEYNTWYARRYSNIKVSNNIIHHIGKNAMIIRCTDETGLIERNVCYETALGTTGNTIFSARAKGTVFQYNEGYFNRATTQTVDPGTIDGSLYDPDYGSVGIIFQYSYSHDNSEGLYWGCNTRGSANNTTGIPDPEDVGCTLRYNISQNDMGDLIFFNYPSAGNEIYNNVFYLKSGMKASIIHESSSKNHTYNFYNNIIYNLSSSTGYNFGSGTGIQTRTIENNLFYGNHPSTEPADINKLISDPKFIAPGMGGIGLNTLDGYKLLSDSPAKSNGKIAPNTIKFDFFNNVINTSKPLNRGVFEGINATAAPIVSNQIFCGTLIPTVGNLVAIGTAIQWYADATGGMVLASSTVLSTKTYYATQTVNGIESERIASIVTVNSTSVPTASAQVFNSSSNPLVADLVATGIALKWYSITIGDSALASTTALTSGTYYVSQTLNACESSKVSVQVTVNTLSTPLPVANAQTFCNAATVANLVATGTAIQWYADAIGGTALIATTALSTKTYYATQTVNGIESERLPLLVTINQPIAGFISASSSLVCSGTGLNLTLNNFNGTISWQKSTNWTAATPTWSTITGQISKTLSTGSLTSSTAFRTILSIGTCNSVSSNYIVNVSKAAKVTSISGGNSSSTAACIGTKVTLKLASGYVGTIQWMSATSSKGTYTAIAGANSSTYDYYPQTTATMYFKVRMTSTPCSATATSSSGIAVFAKNCQSVARLKRESVELVEQSFSVLTFPNPFSSTFKLKLTTSSAEPVLIKTYDMIGKLIEVLKVNSSDVEYQELGYNYSYGVFNIVISQGKNMKSIRVIKK
ncbi:immunoglobulin domain-containing protein [Flavobacterium luteum]|uniref:T9SS type A sorting domain-containing protein n=1 Tax=Flavobacterium luteum TaxID=2026654 RepID=A0A7J5ABK3_9FLAO|nr:hypothetical protein [Flavobacterium luteum]KAB1154937.1 hypothetical protein F6464_10960 [Flavobacterium luteum]